MAKHRLTTYSNARRYTGEDGHTYVVTEDALELCRQIADEDRELLDRLAQQ